MSNTLYDISRQAFLTGALNWTGGSTFAVALIDSSQYTVDPSADQHLSDIPSGAILDTQDLANPTASAGAALADAVTTTSDITGTMSAIVIYEDTGDPTTSQLVCYIDTGSNLPTTYDGTAPASIVWDTSSGSGIFKL